MIMPPKYMFSAMVALAMERYKTTDAIAESIHDQLTEYTTSELTRSETKIDTVIEYTCAVFGISTTKIKQKTRKREVVEARQAAMYLLGTFTKMSLKRIGLEFGGRDHSTVIHAKKVVGDLMDTDKQFREKCSKCITFAGQLFYNNEK